MTALAASAEARPRGRAGASPRACPAGPVGPAARRACRLLQALLLALLLPVACAPVQGVSSRGPTLAPGETAIPVGRAQAGLFRLGYNPGPVDGLWGPRTAAAVRAFQAEEGLPISGVIDYPFADRLEARLAGLPPPIETRPGVNAPVAETSPLDPLEPLRGPDTDPQRGDTVYDPDFAPAPRDPAYDDPANDPAYDPALEADREIARADPLPDPGSEPLPEPEPEPELQPRAAPEPEPEPEPEPAPPVTAAPAPAPGPEATPTPTPEPQPAPSRTTRAPPASLAYVSGNPPEDLVAATGTAPNALGDIRFALADLNGDGRRDAVWHNAGARFCGAAGCAFQVLFRSADGSWRRVARLLASEVQLADSATGGVRDLLVTGRRGRAVWRFSGGRYAPAG
ncbi:MAG: peptidoglycan-binding domain-containing protein [Pseudomonadota bacterium]